MWEKLLIGKVWAAYPSDLPPEPTQARCQSLAWDPSLWNQLNLSDLTCIFNRVYNTAILTVSGVFIIWAILSGIRYMSASGDEKAVADARRSLTMAILGFIIVVGAYALIRILGNVIGLEKVPVFIIPSP